MPLKAQIDSASGAMFLATGFVSDKTSVVFKAIASAIITEITKTKVQGIESGLAGTKPPIPSVGIISPNPLFIKDSLSAALIAELGKRSVSGSQLKNFTDGIGILGTVLQAGNLKFSALAGSGAIVIKTGDVSFNNQNAFDLMEKHLVGEKLVDFRTNEITQSMRDILESTSTVYKKAIDAITGTVVVAGGTPTQVPYPPTPNIGSIV